MALMLKQCDFGHGCLERVRSYCRKLAGRRFGPNSRVVISNTRNSIPVLVLSSARSVREAPWAAFDAIVEPAAALQGRSDGAVPSGEELARVR